jgi:hypothetical protein
MRSLQLLERWLDHVGRYFHFTGSDRKNGYYGLGYNAWSVQTNQKFVAALSVLNALSPESFPEDRRRQAREMALAGLRFSLESHLAGNGHCSDGTSWGHTWISTLGLERMLHAYPLVLPHLTGGEKDLLRTVLCSEADWLNSDDYGRGPRKGIQAGLWARDGGNHPESNIWNGAFLWRIAALYPDHPHRERWQEQAVRFLVNGISIGADAADTRMIDGAPLKDRHVGSNFFPHYALDHHRYLNVGYSVICLSNVAMLHFDSRIQGFPPPESLYLHTSDLWQVVKKTLFADGRLARIGGDSRVRYAYCQEYLMPTLLFAADHLQDPHALELLANQLTWIEQEAEHNGDGSFYSKRLSWLRRRDPVYYTRLESDRANGLGMVAAYWNHMSDSSPTGGFETSVAGGWSEPDHGALLQRSTHRLASFSWRSALPAQGMCQPPADGHLAEWERNLTGHVAFLGENPDVKQRALIGYRMEAFAGGFWTAGSFHEGMDASLGEGWRGTELARHHLAFVALPDGHSILGIEYAVIGATRACVKRAGGLHLNLPNDLFNNFTRKIESSSEQLTLARHAASEGDVSIPADRIILDGRIGVAGIYGGSGFQIVRPEQRTAGRFRSLFVETLFYGGREEAFIAEAGEIVIDAAWQVASHAETLEKETFLNHLPASRVAWPVSHGRAVQVTGLDQQLYRLFVNFGETDVTLGQADWPETDQEWQCLRSDRVRTGSDWAAITLPPGEALLIRKGG